MAQKHTVAFGVDLECDSSSLRAPITVKTSSAQIRGSGASDYGYASPADRMPAHGSAPAAQTLALVRGAIDSGLWPLFDTAGTKTTSIGSPDLSFYGNAKSSSGLRAGAPVPLFLQVLTASDDEALTVTLQAVGHAPIGYIKRQPRIFNIQSGSGSRRWLD
ncbi:hypothetical protein MRX96_026696 [Rhipicephalus microplus]